MFDLLKKPLCSSLSGLLLVSIFSVPVFSQELQKQEPDKTTKAEQQSKTYNRGTKDLPVIIQIAPSAPLKVETDRDKEAEKEKALNEGRIANGTIAIAIFTFVLAFATIGLAVFTYSLWGETGKLVRGAEDTAKRQLRAYVMVSRAKIVINPEPGYSGQWVFIEAKNFGQTPAAAVKYWISMDAKECPLTTVLTRDPLSKTQSVGVIAPSHTFETRVPVPLLDNGNEIHTGTHALYVYGEFRYTDAFNREQVTNLRYMRSGEYWATDGQIEVCQDGNDAT